MSFNDNRFPIAYSTNSRFDRKLVLPRSKGVRRGISRLAAEVNRTWHNGNQPISGLFTLVGKAERLVRGHGFRDNIATILRHRRRDREKTVKNGPDQRRSEIAAVGPGG